MLFEQRSLLRGPGLLPDRRRVLRNRPGMLPIALVAEHQSPW
jgi:hypothetical protein